MSEFDRIIGYDDVKLELIRFCDVFRNPDKYRELGVAVPSGILLHGEPGVGKTSMAKIFIAESGCESITLRKEKPNGAFVEEIRATYQKAKDEGIRIVFLDDVDKFANEDESRPNAEEYVTIQSCIDEYKEYGVFTLATANDLYSLPESLRRSGRFDKIIFMKWPKGKDAINIIRHYLSMKKVIGDVDAEEIAKLMDGYSCADLESVINEAGIYAGFDNRKKIGQKDLIKACTRFLFEGPESVDDDYSQDAMRRTAYHEAGHAVVSELLIPESVSLVSVNRHSGPTGGLAKYVRFEERSDLPSYQEYRIMRLLAGKAATEVVYGTADLGCRTDMGLVFDDMSRLVDDNCAYGFDTYEYGSSSEYLLEKKNRLTVSEVERLYKLTKKLILDNRAFLDAVVDELMKNETITYRGFQNLKKGLGICA